MTSLVRVNHVVVVHLTSDVDARAARPMTFARRAQRRDAALTA